MRVLLKRASVGRIFQTTSASSLQQTRKFQLLRRLLQWKENYLKGFSFRFFITSQALLILRWFAEKARTRVIGHDGEEGER
jgi:hypothetical protein